MVVDRLRREEFNKRRVVKVSRYTESVCKLCRREGIKLFLKGNRCYTDKCEIEKRNFPPGLHGHNKIKLTQYGVQLREKQKLRRIYGLTERQFSRFYGIAARQKGNKGECLLSLLERRLDNVVYSLGFAASRKNARQLVNHGFILIDGKKVDIPSFVVRIGNTIELKEKIKSNVNVQSSISSSAKQAVPRWLELDPVSFKATVKTLPERQDISILVQEQLVVELYSKH